MALKELEKLNNIFSEYPEIKLVYFFGSRAEGNAGPMSDFDFAFYADEKDRKKLFSLKLALMERVSLLLRTDKVDISVLNLIEGPELKYFIIKNGKLIFEREPFKVIVEPRILSEYFDFHTQLSHHNLTGA